MIRTIFVAFFLFLTSFNSFVLGFTSQQREAIEADNNVLASKGYIVENLFFRNKQLGRPALMTAGTNGKICILNHKRELFLWPGLMNFFSSGLKSFFPAGAIDIALSAGGVIIGLDKSEVFNVARDGKKVSLARISNALNPSRLALDNKDVVYVIDELAGKVYFLNKRGILQERQFDFPVQDICFDKENNMYILAASGKVYVLGRDGKNFKRSYDIPEHKNPGSIAVNGNGSQIYFLDKDGKEIFAATRYGEFRDIAILSSYHKAHSRPIVNKDDSICLLTGGAPADARIIRIAPEKVSKGYWFAYAIGNNSSDVLKFDKEDNLYCGEGRNIVKINKDSSLRETIMDREKGLRDPESIVWDAPGNCYISDDLAGKIFKIDKNDNTISVYADSRMGLQEPQAAVFDKSGNAFIGDEEAKMIFKITPQGVVSEFITQKDGLCCLEDIAIDSKDFIYVAPEWDDRILKISPQGKVSVFADGQSGLIGPGAITIDSRGFVYVADEESSAVYKFNPEGKLEGAVKINLATLRHLGGIAVSSTGKVYVYSGEIKNGKIYEVNFKPRDRKKSEVGEGIYSIRKLCGSEDGLFLPRGVAFDNNKGRLYISTSESIFKYEDNKLSPVVRKEYAAFRELVVDKKGELFSAGGGGNIYHIGKDHAVDVLASRKDGLVIPEGITLDGQERIYVTDKQGHSIVTLENGKVKKVKGIEYFEPRKIAYHRGYFYLAEDGEKSFSKISIDPGEDFKARLIEVKRGIPGAEGIAIDKDGVIYLSSDTLAEIYKLEQLNGEKIVVADWRDGLVGPESLALDSEGNLYVADSEAQAVFKITKIK
jgi:sugar lactone lactonase YvrE